eukprot:XP_001700912.1 predicted protein [Chlamydomonas reinhardtii]
MALGRRCHSGTVHLYRTEVTAPPRARRIVSQRSIHTAATAAEKAFSARGLLVRSGFSTVQAEGLLVVFPTTSVIASKQDIKDLELAMKDLQATQQQSIKDLQAAQEKGIKELETKQQQAMTSLETKQQQAATVQQQAMADYGTQQLQAYKDLQMTLNHPLATIFTFLSKMLPLGMEEGVVEEEQQHAAAGLMAAPPQEWQADRDAPAANTACRNGAACAGGVRRGSGMGLPADLRSWSLSAAPGTACPDC